jgi:hypothetical protein
MNTNTTHPLAWEELTAFVDGELAGERNDFAAGHIAECEECQRVEAGLRQTSQILHGWKIEALPAGVETKVRDAAALASHEGAMGRTPRLRFPVWARWALGLGLSAVVVLILGRSGARQEEWMAPTPRPGLSLPAAQSASSAYIARLPERGRELELKQKAEAELNSSLAEERNGQPGSADKLATTAWLNNIAASPAAGPPPPPAPMIARTMSMSIVVKDFAVARGRLDVILARHQGYEAQLTVNTPEGAPRTLQASLRVPAPELAAAIAELKALGRVENETQSGEEVTQQHADLVARLKNSRETEQRLRAILLQRTGKISDVLEVEQEIARVRGEIEQMEAEQKSLEHRVDFATINLNLADVYQAQLTAPFSVGTRLRNGFVAGYHGATETLLGIALFFIESGPSLLIWLLLLGLPVFFVWRRYRRSLATI